MSKKKYRGEGYGFQTDKEFEKSRQVSDNAKPGCFKGLTVFALGGGALHFFGFIEGGNNQIMEGVLVILLIIISLFVASR